MALDIRSQKFILAQDIVNLGTTIDNALAQINRINRIFVKSGVTWTSGDFDGTALAYVAPADMPTIVTNLNTLVTMLTAGGTFGANFGDIFAKYNPGT